MKQNQLIDAIKAGKILLVGKFVFMKKEVVPYRDRDGKPATFNKLEFAVLGANGIIFVQPDTRKMPDFKMDTYVCPFKEMDLVVVEVERMETEKGQTTISGMAQKLEA